MTLRGWESFDLASAAQLHAGTGGWEYAGEASRITIVTGRTGNAMQMTPSGGFVNTLEKVIDAQAEWYVGFAHYLSAAPSAANRICAFYDGANLQCEVFINTSRQVELRRAGTLLATSVLAVATGTANHFECYAKVHNTTGAMEVRVNGVSWVSVTGANTRGGSSSDQADRFRIGTSTSIGSVTVWWDDVYWADGNGSQTWSGDLAVQAKLPTGAGDTTDWTPSTGSNYQCVDDAPANDDTDYVSTATVNNVDTYAIADLTGTIASVKGLQTVFRARKDDAGSSSVAPVVRPGSTDNVGVDVPQTTTYGHFREVFLLNPDTTAAWSASEVNATKIGVKRTA